MTLNSTPSSERLHISFFGLRNAGKSSLVNAVTNQKLSLVSDIPGTTTDPVKKTMELLPIGPVVIIDTPGIDDEGSLGAMRVERALDMLDSTDIAVLVVDATKGEGKAESELINKFSEKKIPFIVALNKADLLSERKAVDGAVGGANGAANNNRMFVSSKTGEGINELREAIGRLKRDGSQERTLISDLISAQDLVVLVTPIDAAAPKGRLILPQQQTLRNILDCSAIAVVTKETELEATLNSLGRKPRIVITDSQAFGFVSKAIPESIPLTSFSILFARYKGNLWQLVDGAETLDKLKDGDTVLISEGCTHHRQCGDIGTEKLPSWIRKYTGKAIEFDFTSGGEFPKELSKYALVVHCGGCMLSEREVAARLERCGCGNVPVTNFGTAIAKMNGILERSLQVFNRRG